jgi:PAS domain S-box-containing protein
MKESLNRAGRDLAQQLSGVADVVKTFRERIAALLAGQQSGSPVFDFAVLRGLVILAGYSWWLLAGLPASQRRPVALLLHAFAAYSATLYLWVYPHPRRVGRVSLLVLTTDVGFATGMIWMTGGIASPFYLALYLIAALQAFYYGIRRGLWVCAYASILYLAAAWTTVRADSIDLISLRLGFMILIVLTLGILSQRERRRRAELAEKSAQLEEAYATQRDLQEHLSNIMGSITNGIIAVDREVRVTAVNRVVEARNGISPAEVFGRRLADVLPAFEKEGVVEALRGVLCGEVDALHMRELEHETRRQGRMIVNLDAYPLRDSRGDLHGAVLVIEDVTSRVTLERQMRQTEKLSALGTLAAGIAHEINNPLGVITSRVEVIMMEAEGMQIPPRLRDDLRVIDRHAHRVARIAQGLLSFSRQTAWRQVPVDVNRLIEEVLPLMEKQLQNDRISLERRLAQDLPKVMGSPNHLEQVLLNLLTNAREATAAGGSIRVESQRGADGHHVQVVIADTGSGIPADVMGRIFDPFFTTKKDGTGLGLSISYGIIRDHDGTLDVTSETGKGTTFTITLPAAQR